MAKCKSFLCRSFAVFNASAGLVAGPKECAVTKDCANFEDDEPNKMYLSGCSMSA